MTKRIVTQQKNSTSEDSLLSTSEAKKECNRGAVAGRNAARRGFDKRTDFAGESESYKGGYEEGFEEVSSKLTCEDIKYNRGAEARQGYANRTDFAGESRDALEDFDESFASNPNPSDAVIENIHDELVDDTGDLQKQNRSTANNPTFFGTKRNTEESKQSPFTLGNINLR